MLAHAYLAAVRKVAGGGGATARAPPRAPGLAGPPPPPPGPEGGGGGGAPPLAGAGAVRPLPVPGGRGLLGRLRGARPPARGAVPAGPRGRPPPQRRARRCHWRRR